MGILRSVLEDNLWTGMIHLFIPPILLLSAHHVPSSRDTDTNKTDFLKTMPCSHMS